MSRRPEQPGRRRVTMTDVARLAGVSQATVSFVLNEKSGQSISETTRARVRDAVAELRYRPHGAARSLRTNRTGSIGFVTDEIASNPFAGATILGAHEEAWTQGSLLLVVNTTRDRKIVRAVIDELVNRPVDAIIFAVVGTRQVSLPEELKGTPAMVLNGFVARGWLPAVLPDEVVGGRQATELLLAAGHRDVAYLTGPNAAWATRARLRGHRQALKAAGLDARRQVREGNFRADSGYELTRDLLRHGPLPTAIMCGNDRMALGAYQALLEAGVRIPDDVSVVGYDDQTDLACDIRPALTTVRLPYFQMGRWAAANVLAGDLASLPPRTFLPCPVVERDSVGPPRTDAT